MTETITETTTTNAPVAAIPRDTGRRYALHARSRNLTAEQNDILTRAGAGHEVDVVEFRKAATAALSLAATRAGQSMARREWTREARHLLYWADAIIDQHIKGLPVYEGGPRSPRIAELELEVEHAGVVNQSLTRDLTNLKQAASDERRRLCKQYDDLKASANDEVTRLLDIANKRDALLAETVRDRDVLGAVVGYIFEALGEQDRARVLGYWDAQIEHHSK